MPDELPPFDDDFIAGASISEPSARQRARRRPRLPRPPRRRPARSRRGASGETMSYLKASGLVGGAVVVLGAAATGMWWLGRDDSPKPSSITLKLQSPTPSAAPSDPFAGSPAASYADGEAGIEMPAAKAMNGLTGTDVEAAYARIKRILVAADLDQATVYSGDTKPLAGALDPEEAKALPSHRAWMTAFAPGSAVAATGTVKVHGTVVPSAGKDGLTVKTDHNFVYAVHPPNRPDLVQRVIVRRSAVFTATREGGDVRVWMNESGRSAAPAPCAAKDDWIRPTFRGDPSGGGTDTNRPEDPYDMSKPPTYDNACHSVIRT
ncbi:hypothetical protein [Actinomadura rupiterrae]|uniref:hypothetical protein n=1 Tax=Actinomadura rupiterrae TaxID=559627 RepID=UPI0020A3709A|nr:hypothetical protein [Actinomadura rupiterrae]MCP2340030.1 hypothetical protein [Actinomadura rupiterrae]